MQHSSLNVVETGHTDEISPFAYPVYRSIWFSNLAFNTGILVLTVGASWLMVEVGASSEMVALVQTSISLPLVFLSPLSGAVADNIDRRKVMMRAQYILVMVSILLAAFAQAQLVTPWLLIGCTFVVGCCLAFNGPAWMASVGDIMPRSAIPNAVIYNSLALNMARSLGPALGGVIVAVAGAAATFLVNALTSLGLLVVLARWRPDQLPRSSPTPRLLGSVVAGVQYAARSGPISAALAAAFFFGLTASSVQALMPLVARDILDGGPMVFGLLFGSFGVGALSGALSTRKLRMVLSPRALVQLSTIMIAVGGSGAALSTTTWLTSAALGIAGAGWVIAYAAMNVTVQLGSPRWVVARTMSLYQMAVFAGVALGSWLSGITAEQIGTSGALLSFAAASVTVVLIKRLLPDRSAA